MRPSNLWLPVLLGVAVIFLSSQFGSVPATPPWLPRNVELDTIAHLLLYLLLGILVARYVSSTSRAGTPGVLVVAAALCTLVGVLDEFHQMYITGRTAEFRDVLADLAGSMVGAAGYLVLVSMVRWVRRSTLLPKAGLARSFTGMAAAVMIAVSLIVPVLLYAPVVTPAADATLAYAKAWSKGAVADALGLEVPRTVAEAQGHAQVVASDKLRSYKSDAVQTRPESARVQRGTTRLADLDEETRRELVQEIRNEITKEFSKGAPSLGTARQLQVPAVGDLRELNEGLSRTEQTLVHPEQNSTQPRVVNTVYREPQVSGLAQVRPAPSLRSTELVAVIANPENSVGELSVEEVRKLLGGAYSTWKQLGGDDTPVQVVMPRDAAGNLQDLLKVTAGTAAARLFYNSLMIPSVAHSRGTVGFVIVKTVEQLQVIVTQESVKVIPIKSDSTSAAVPLSRPAVFGGTYPLTRDHLAARNWPVQPSSPAQQVVLSAQK